MGLSRDIQICCLGNPGSLSNPHLFPTPNTCLLTRGIVHQCMSSSPSGCKLLSFLCLLLLVLAVDAVFHVIKGNAMSAPQIPPDMLEGRSPKQWPVRAASAGAQEILVNILWNIFVVAGRESFSSGIGFRVFTERLTW